MIAMPSLIPMKLHHVDCTWQCCSPSLHCKTCPPLIALLNNVHVVGHDLNAEVPRETLFETLRASQRHILLKSVLLAYNSAQLFFVLGVLCARLLLGICVLLRPVSREASNERLFEGTFVVI